MLENIEILLEHRNLSIDAIFDFLKKGDNYSQLKFINTFCDNLVTENDYEKVIINALENYENRKCFDKEDIELLKGYFSVMGKTDLSGQISNCRLYKNFFCQKLQKLETEENQKCKSMGTFIIGAGVLVIIILI